MASSSEPKIKVRGSYSVLTIIEQLTRLGAQPREFTLERRGYDELSRLAIPLIVLSLVMSMILVPTIAYYEVRQDVTSKYYDSIGESQLFPSAAFDEQRAEEEIAVITSNTIRFLISEKWHIIIFAGLIVIPLYALILIVMLFVRAVVRHAYLKLLGGNGTLGRQLTLEAYYALLWGPIGVLVLLLSIAVTYSTSIIPALFLLIVLIAITVWNWYVYVHSIAALHELSSKRAFVLLISPVIVFVLAVGLAVLALIGIAARMIAVA
jgi:hypothetical protein